MWLFAAALVAALALALVAAALWLPGGDGTRRAGNGASAPATATPAANASTGATGAAATPSPPAAAPRKSLAEWDAFVT
ncbi:MAG: hypothetical protein HGB10_10715, partial [Coriobacteriia bacterium]|nr:hypothetical protein [Coriobacteriia bacterium]